MSQCTVFFLVEGKILLHENLVSARSAIMGLIGMYFVYDRRYPTSYHSFLRFLENKVLGVSEKPFERGTLTYNRLMDLYNKTT